MGMSPEMDSLSARKHSRSWERGELSPPELKTRVKLTGILCMVEQASYEVSGKFRCFYRVVPSLTLSSRTQLPHCLLANATKSRKTVSHEAWVDPTIMFIRWLASLSTHKSLIYLSNHHFSWDWSLRLNHCMCSSIVPLLAHCAE